MPPQSRVIPAVVLQIECLYPLFMKHAIAPPGSFWAMTKSLASNRRCKCPFHLREVYCGGEGVAFVDQNHVRFDGYGGAAEGGNNYEIAGREAMRGASVELDLS